MSTGYEELQRTRSFSEIAVADLARRVTNVERSRQFFKRYSKEFLTQTASLTTSNTTVGTLQFYVPPERSFAITWEGEGFGWNGATGGSCALASVRNDLPQLRFSVTGDGTPVPETVMGAVGTLFDVGSATWLKRQVTDTPTTLLIPWPRGFLWYPPGADSPGMKTLNVINRRVIFCQASNPGANPPVYMRNQRVTVVVF